jgi:hypothetical protein
MEPVSNGCAINSAAIEMDFIGFDLMKKIMDTRMPQINSAFEMFL